MDSQSNKFLNEAMRPLPNSTDVVQCPKCSQKDVNPSDMFYIVRFDENGKGSGTCERCGHTFKNGICSII